jgi:hypothetical protein
MPEETGRFEWVAKLARVVFTGTVILLGAALVATVATAVLALLDPTEGSGAVAWVLAAVAELVALMWTFVLYGVIRLLVANEYAAAGATARISRLEALLNDATRSINDLAELAPLSDQAKSLLFRDRELEALREAIHEDLMRQDYRTAEALVETIEARLGFAEQAAQLREEIVESRKATLEEKIEAALKRIDGICEAHDWTRAIRESKRVMRLFPDNEKVASLPERIEKARMKNKRELLQAYGEAVRKNDVDRGVELLRELDMYLTPQEGAALAESARGVFKAKLHNLGVQFAICVTERRWLDAIAAGEDIMREFPNSRFAQEVREKMDLLRSRAAEEAEPAAT